VGEELHLHRMPNHPSAKRRVLETEEEGGGNLLEVRKCDVFHLMLLCAVPLNTYQPAARGNGKIIFGSDSAISRHVKQFFPGEIHPKSEP
jgi:hypothetical protein